MTRYIMPVLMAVILIMIVGKAFDNTTTIIAEKVARVEGACK